jgi:protein-disulfide isomerase
MIKKTILVTTLAVWALAAQSTATAQDGGANTPSTGMANEVEKEILAELRQIRLLLERQQQPQAPAAAPVAETAKVSTTGYYLGSKDAPLTLVEFADYQCPFCKQFQSTVFDRLKKDYIDTGKLRVVSRDLPLDMHSNAMAAAQAARCAGEQDKFWQMHDTLIAHSDRLAAEAVGGYANELGLDMKRFQQCVASETGLSSIRKDIAEATSAGIAGTPSFVIGTTSGDSVEGIKVVGALSYESFEKILAGYLAKPGPQ